MTELFSSTLTLAQSSSSGGGGGAGGAIVGLVFLLVVLGIIIFLIGGMWKTFEKAGHPGWAAIIPIYNVIVLLQIAGRPIWWVILFFLPIVSIFAFIVVSIDIAKSFGKDWVYGLGIAFFPYIFYPILGYGNATYQGPSAA